MRTDIKHPFYIIYSSLYDPGKTQQNVAKRANNVPNRICVLVISYRKRIESLNNVG